jgi:nucleotide-binding universal stress UspA family protein
MFRRILVPVDGSPASNLGLDEAIKLAAGEDVTLCLLHVVDEFAVAQGMDGPMYGGAAYVEGFLNALREGGKKILTKAEARASKRGVKTDAVLVETMGRGVADIILNQAKKARADLIVMGTHGRRGVVRLVMGSDAEGVVRGARTPVLLVRSTREPRSRRKRK